MKQKQQRQNGAVLILTLVVLLMLTFYGVVSTRDAKTQYQIAGNAQAYSIALAEAEGVLTKAENTIDCLRETDVTDPDSYPVDAIPTTFTSVAAGCTGGDYLTADDISANKITVAYDSDTWDSVEVLDADGNCDFIFRKEDFVITVVSNHPKSGRREVRSDYVAIAKENCH